MNGDKRTIQSALDEVLKSAGFSRRGSRWLRKSADVVESVDLQKSQWGAQFRISIGLWLVAIGPWANVADKDMHIRVRAESLTSAAMKETLLRCLDLEQDIGDEERHARLESIVRETLVPSLERWQALSGVRADLKSSVLASAFVTAEGRAVLERVGEPHGHE